MPIDLAADAALMTDFDEAVDFRVSPNATAREDLGAKVNRTELDAQGREDSAGPFNARRQAVMHVMLRNHATAGVLPTEIVPRSSEVKVAYPQGAATEATGLRWRRILRILKHNAGFVLVEVQA